MYKNIVQKDMNKFLISDGFFNFAMPLKEKLVSFYFSSKLQTVISLIFMKMGLL